MIVAEQECFGPFCLHGTDAERMPLSLQKGVNIV